MPVGTGERESGAEMVRPRLLAVAMCLGLGIAATGCRQGNDVEGPVRLTVWFHGGQRGEQAVLAAQVARFNARFAQIQVSVTGIPEADYPDRVQLAAVTGQLPDVLDFDGPNLMNYVYQGQLSPLDHLVSRSVIADLTPSIRSQGTLDGRLYSVGAIDSGLGLYASRRALGAVGARIPRGWSDAWTAAEFGDVLRRLSSRDPDGRVLDMSVNYGIGEWYTYAFAPVVWSAGGSFGRSPDFDDARSSLATPEVARALTLLGVWARRYVDPDATAPADALATGRVALSWDGHWRYPGYHRALGDDLLVLPLPDFGNGAKTDSGSWNWGISSRSSHPEQAARFLDFLMSPAEVLATSQASAAPPGTVSASRLSTLYRPDGPLALFTAGLAHACGAVPDRGCVAVSRPPTPAYPVMTNAFQEVIRSVLSGADARASLIRAAELIDEDRRLNGGYLRDTG
jgi:multiple sugar transport system substrate-binding protein